MRAKMRDKTMRHYVGGVVFLILLGMTFGPGPNRALAQQGGEVPSTLIEDNVIVGNTAGSGGGIAGFNALSVIRNNLLIQNVSTGEEGGGAIYSSGASSKPTITGNTVSGNIAGTANGGGIYIKEGDAIISNCILWLNQGDLWNFSATYSLVTNLQTNPGTGNLSTDPLFIQTTDPDAPGYFQLSENSPCVDAGDPAYRPALNETDINGKSRIVWGRVDIGADELADTQGPTISNAKFDNTNLSDGIVLNQSGTFTLNAADPSAVSRVEFSIDGKLVYTDTNGADGYSYVWNIFQTEDGSHTLTITSYDTLGNSKSVTYTIDVALNPPSAPTISSPASGAVLNTVNITVSGQADKNTSVLIYNNNAQTGNSVSVDSNGIFRIPITLTEGVNRLQAAATNRAGSGPKSSEVAVTLDTSIPKAPPNLSALSKAGGIISLTWGTPTGTSINGYNVYRAAASFTSTSQAVKVNASLITKTSFDDLAPADGTYYYAASTVNLAGQEGPLSNIASAVSDRTPPRAVSIQYTPTGPYTSTPLRIGQGLVNIQLIVSEPLLSTPFLSITPNGGVPIQVDLAKTSDLQYSGAFVISASMPSGTAYAVFSARDVIGNRGTSIDSGSSFIIDTEGPAVSSLQILPAQPIQNNQANPVSVTVTIGLNEQVKPGSAPQLSYLLSGPGRTQTSINQPSQIATQPGQVQTWQAAFTLPADAGLAAVENLQFIYSGTDDLDNVSNRILCGNSFQVYQGNLPPLSPPQTLTGKSLPAGKIDLTWTAVDRAAGYQLYRKAPTDTQLTPYQAFGLILEFTDSPSPDGLYQYAVASIRHENNQEAISGMSNVIVVASDSTPPGAPQNLALQLTGSGIKATWVAPPNTEPFTYSLYRSGASEITSVQGMTPILTGITTTTVVDAYPSHTAHCYVVTAVDNAGNESLPSNSFYLNFDLLPVSTLTVVQQEDGFPVISWTHGSGDIAGYNVYLVNNGQPGKLNSSLVTGLSYPDAGYAGDDRLYTVTAVDHNGIESMGRSITLPRLIANLKSGEQIKRNIINRLDYTVENHSLFEVDHIELKALVDTYQHQSEEFSVDANSTQDVSIPVGGYADLPDSITFSTTIEITPEEGELVQIVRSKQIDVVDDRLMLQILNEPFTRGGLGKVWFTLQNTGEEEIEIITATGSGASASNEVTFSLLDGDGNTLSSLAYKQNLGASVVTLPNGTTVARIPAGSTYTSDPVQIPVPLTAPDQVSVRITVTNVHFDVGEPDQVTISGLSATGSISLKDTPYYGEIVAITPESSTGDQNILITGRAIDRTTGLPEPSVPLKLVITVAGFERTNSVVTDNQGNFTFTFTPLVGESGIYTVRAVHPDIYDKLVQGQFTISKLSISPTTINLNIAKNYEQSANIQVTTSEGTIAHNLRLAYEQQDQTSGTFPTGVHVSLGTSVGVLGSKQTATLSFTIWGDNTAAAAGRVVLKVKSDETGNDAWGSIVINTQFSDSKPALYYSPDHVETGVAFDQVDTETITLQNGGLADLNDVSVAVISQDGTAAPTWVTLNSVPSLGVIAVGESRQVSVSFSPASGSVTEGVYSLYLQVTSSNYQTTNIGIYVSVTESGIGNAIFKVSDIYTGTVNQSGQIIQGLAGAKISIQNEQVLTVQQTMNTDSVGEILFTGLPAGVYKYRASATNHQDQVGRLWIKPGITASQQVFLDYNLVTVQWNVTETTIKDKYEIVITATYETNVPAAVVAIEPKSVTLPDMKTGDVFYGEFSLTNYGLIRAQNMTFTMPATNSYYKYEILQGAPTSLEAKERITLPYRVTALRSNNQSDEGSGSGGGCDSYVDPATASYEYDCANGGKRSGSDSSYFTYVPPCTSVPGSPGGTINIGGGGGGAPSGGGGGGGCSNCSPSGDPLPGVDCPDPRTCSVDDQCCSGGGGDCDCSEPAASKVDLLRGEYRDDVTDMFIKVPGYRLEVNRRFYDDKWYFDPDDKKLGLIYGNAGGIDSIYKAGVFYRSTDIHGTVSSYQVFSFKTDRNIYVRENNTYRWEDKSGNWAEYDASGRMTSYGNPNNVKVSMIYETGQNGKLIGIADNSGTQVLWYEYNPSGTLSAVRDASGRRVQYFYDSSSRLSKVVDVLGNESLYTYDSNGKMISKQDAAGRKYSVTYNNYGFVSSVTNEAGYGKFFDYAYDAGTQQRYSMVKYSSGKIVERWNDRFGNKIRKDINGRTLESVLVNGTIKTFSDAAGNKTTKEYDDRNNLIKQTNPDGTTKTYTYESRFSQVIQEVNENGVVTKYEYDTVGNMTRKTEAIGTANERTTEYTYDSSDNLLTVKAAGDAKTADATTVMTYDGSGNLISQTDPEGNTTQFTYDNMGNMLTRKDARNKVWSYGYDGMGRLISQTDPLSNNASYEYDGVGNKTKETDAEGNVKTYEYDSENRMVKATDPLGDLTQFVYNTDDNLIKQSDQEGRFITYEYDLDGRLTKTIDGNGNETTTEYNDTAGSCSSCSGASGAQPARTIFPTYTKEYKYDSRGRRIEEKDVLSSTESYSAQASYDAVGSILSKTDKENKTTAYEYDYLARRIKVTDPLTGMTEYIFDNRNNLISLKDPKGNITTFEYDRNNRLKKETRPLGQATTYQYDATGNLIHKIDAKNQKIEYAYNDAGRLIKAKYFAVATDTTPAKTVDFTYDKAGNLKTYDDGTTSATYIYDDAYRKLSETLNHGDFSLAYSYTYYKNGKKKSLTMPDGTTYEYTYDNNNQLSLISIPGQGFMTYNQYTWNMPSRVTLPGGTRRDNTYTPLMQLKSLNVKDPAQNPLMAYDYAYSPIGNVTSKNTEQGNYTYQYDELYRLIGTTNGSNGAYTYDAVGNRLTSADVQGDWTYNENNELLSYNGVMYEYDNNGNIVSKSDQSGTTTFTYDVENRLVQVRNPQSAIYNYYYDPFGKRLWKEVNGVKTYFFYSDEGLIGEYNATGLEIKTYGYAPNSTWTTNPLFQKIGTNYYWYQNDHLGTPQKIIDSSGAVVWSATYDVFGKANVTVATIENNLRFPGQYYDQETGLHYNWNRYYDPKTGRYLTSDPIGLEDGINLFVYVQNNPINWVDSSGLAVWDGECARKVAGDVFKQSLSSGIPGVRIDSTPWNAYLHCMWSCEMVKQCGRSTAFLAGTGHEIWDRWRIPLIAEPSASMMDLHNNAEGRDCGKGNNECKKEKKEKKKSCDECCREKLKNGDLIYLVGHGASGGW